MNTKKFFQIIAVSATALLTACEERLTSPDCETPITVTSQVSETTRAGYEGTTNLPDNFVMDIYQGGGSYDYSLVEMTREQNSNTFSAPNGTLLLWKGTDTNHSGASVKAMTIPDGRTTIDPTNAMIISVRPDQTNADAVEASDLLGAKSGDGITINGDNINIEFRHLMSKLYVNYTFAEGLTGTVNSITLKNTCVKGGYSYKDMDYANSSLSYGDIKMHHNSTDKATEAIFYPYTPTSNPQLEVSIKVNDVDKTLTCPIQFKDNNKSFEGRKKYIMNIRINGTTIDNTSITIVKDWTEDNESIGVELSDKKILWIGTSIPSNHSDFGGRDSYPTMISKALGCEIINNAVAGSLVTFFPDYTTWTADNWTNPNVLNSGNEAEAYTLSATKDEIANKYRTILTNLAWQKFPEDIQNVQTGTNNWGWPIYTEMDVNEADRNQYLSAISAHTTRLQGFSYEELIIPYINGTKDNCDVVVIDHGYNDMNYIPLEVMQAGTISAEAALEWLESLSLEKPNDYIINTPYKNWCNTNNHGVGDKISYIAAMNYIIQKCKEANSNVQIIIGNYFATRTPYYRDNNINGEDYAYIIDCYIKTNETVAAMNGLPIVNVYQHTGLDASNVGNPYYNQVFLGLCPDGIHPGSDPTGTLNKIIADIYIEAFKEIFGK